MAAKTGISWCDSTFNPWIGCTKVSPACDHCYAERDFDLRRHAVTWGAGQPRKRTGVANWQQVERWNARAFAQCDACGWRGESSFAGLGDACPNCKEDLRAARRRVFCASLGDVFDNEVNPLWRADLFALIERTPNLDWLLLTKRIGNVERMTMDALRSMFLQSDKEPTTWPWPNIWLGATVCNQAEADRDIPKLLSVPAAVRFLSIEPMLAPIDLRFHFFSEPTGNFRTHNGKRQMELRKQNDVGIHWVICGGESGSKARPMNPEWARSLRDQCADAGVPFFFKQWGEWLPMLGQAEGVPVKQKTTTPDGWVMGWAGCKAAGRMLDGREHNEFPELA